MKLGLVTGYTGTGVPMDLIHAAEDAGFDSVWTAEAYGSDAIVPLAWIAAQTKKIKLGKGSKANHLTYLGDAVIGAGANVGAGTITANYDGFNKSRTVIGAGAFIGSNTALVAPVTVGDGAMVAAGSVVTQDVAADALLDGLADVAGDGVAEGFVLRGEQVPQRPHGAQPLADREAYPRLLRGAGAGDEVVDLGGGDGECAHTPYDTRHRVCGKREATPTGSIR